MEFYKEMVKLENDPRLELKLYKKIIGCVARSRDAMDIRSITDDMVRVCKIPIEVVYGVVLKSFCVSGRVLRTTTNKTEQQQNALRTTHCVPRLCPSKILLFIQNEVKH